MIAILNGRVIMVGEESIVLDVQGVGFEVFLVKDWLSEIEPSQTHSVYTYMQVREDSISLYGFKTLDEKVLFTQLLGVSGIGPKLALSVLSSLSVENFKRAVLSEQPDYFARVPGIGKKTAQKIIIHFQGKFGPSSPDSEFIISSGVNEQVLEALVGLGYSIVEAQTAIQSLPKSTPDTVEDKLRVALSYFDR